MTLQQHTHWHWGQFNIVGSNTSMFWEAEGNRITWRNLTQTQEKHTKFHPDIHPSSYLNPRPQRSLTVILFAGECATLVFFSFFFLKKKKQQKSKIQHYNSKVSVYCSVLSSLIDLKSPIPWSVSLVKYYPSFIRNSMLSQNAEVSSYYSHKSPRRTVWISALGECPDNLPF